MKILLVQPAKPEKALGGEDFSIFEPLALEYLAADVAGDHDVRILDMRLDPDLDHGRPRVARHVVHQLLEHQEDLAPGRHLDARGGVGEMLDEPDLDLG